MTACRNPATATSSGCKSGPREESVPDCRPIVSPDSTALVSLFIHTPLRSRVAAEFNRSEQRERDQEFLSPSPVFAPVELLSFWSEVCSWKNQPVDPLSHSHPNTTHRSIRAWSFVTMDLNRGSDDFFG